MPHTWFQWYHVNEGDTLWDICEWWWGTCDEYKLNRIWLCNRHIIGEDPGQIFPSTWLRLPYWGFNYRIQSGDTLAQLAEWVYGDQSLYWVIHQANPWISDPNQIQVGWWIWIP
jgi:nucleoid-associated protein YgaU